MKPHDEPLASRALDALADQCELPEDLEERILSAALDDAPAPVIALPEPPLRDAPWIERERAPLSGVIRATRQDERRFRTMGWGAAAVLGLLIAVAVTNRPAAPPREVSALPTSIQMSAPPPAGIKGARVSDSHPRFGEAKELVLVVADHVTKQCRSDRWSAAVRFEKTGQATVLRVTAQDAGERACIEGLLAAARISPREGPRLAVWLEHEAEAGGAPLRMSGWLLDET